MPEERSSAISPRIRGGLIFLPCLAALVASAWLTPRASGWGTHEQLGLPGCSTPAQTGWPCPTCGMTTSFAAMAHGQLGDAAKAQAFGVVLFAATVLFCGVGGAEMATGRDVIRHLRPGWWWLFVAVGGTLAGWGLKAGLGFINGQYPMR
jgi:hypothetical protein